MTTNEMIKKYYDLQKLVEEYKTEMETLKGEIISDMESKDLNKTVTEEGITAQIVNKETFKYNDEIGMIKYLKEQGLNQFIQEKINTTLFNKELKKSGVLTESLNPMFTKTITKSFSVKITD